jgi:hypothetical protein
MSPLNQASRSLFGSSFSVCFEDFVQKAPSDANTYQHEKGYRKYSSNLTLAGTSDIKIQQPGVQEVD